MSDNIDALVYSQMINNIGLTNENSNSIKSYTRTTGSSDQDTYNKLNEILENTTIKRACCMKKIGDGSKIDVRIIDPANPSNSIIKEIYVPESLCKNYTKYGNNGLCDSFMKTYCMNLVEMYKDELIKKGEFDQLSFPSLVSLKFPECSCYAGPPADPRFAKQGNGPICYHPGCQDSINAYWDPDSRVKTDAGFMPRKCSSICISDIEIGKITATTGGIVILPQNINPSCSIEEKNNKNNALNNNQPDQSSPNFNNNALNNNNQPDQSSQNFNNNDLNNNDTTNSYYVSSLNFLKLITQCRNFPSQCFSTIKQSNYLIIISFVILFLFILLMCSVSLTILI